MDANERTGTFPYLPSIAEVRARFDEEITALGGTVRDVYEDGRNLFARAVLRRAADVRPGDTVNGGVALRTLGPELLVHPYIFRQVCVNGAIRAHALQTRRVALVPTTVPAVPGFDVTLALDALGDAVRASAAPEAFKQGLREMRTATEIAADDVVNVLSLLSRHGASRELVLQILARFTHRDEDDRSAFGLMNAVTSVARDTSDPETRWRLEEIGARIPALVARRAPAEPRMVHRDELLTLT
ncbi:hypothetical protein J421_5947 (plasmid) [Gemmatirosa kalamazoonensis]|uniref:Uncharacterized protein n=1 Tax=Gemmatirosa kalamazoonensis TaxID=861299 RepID=W0RSN2_9BACT|nr:hypothetical protein [Gemmatirosa kalamazoonensis]AHG93482.1 hypothetical protein J421_5947 [Gemmatirosa kalamazoonensis]